MRSAARPSFCFSACQRAVSASASSSSAGQLDLQLFSRSAEATIGFLLQRLALDLQLDDAAVELVEFFRLGIHLHAQPRRRLVHQVDRLVRQEPVGDVAVGKRRSRNQRRIGDPHLVMLLVFFLQAAQDRDRVLDRRLVRP